MNINKQDEALIALTSGCLWGSLPTRTSLKSLAEESGAKKEVYDSGILMPSSEAERVWFMRKYAQSQSTTKERFKE